MRFTTGETCETCGGEFVPFFVLPQSVGGLKVHPIFLCADVTSPARKAGGGIAVHGWKKGGAKGKRKLWTLTVTPFPQ